MTTQTTGWIGTGSLRLPPPVGYFDHLAALYPEQPVTKLRELSDRRVNEIKVSDLPPPQDASLLKVMVTDGWLVTEQRRACANGLCDHIPDDDDIAAGRCPECATVIDDANTSITVYTRDLAPIRDVDWVVVIHGMNTKGAWQEEFSWFLGTTWGRSVPVSIYKYGIIIAGVIMPWRRRSLQRALRAKLAELRHQARMGGYGEVPDVVAHSFGTWLFGHILRDEMKSGVKDPLRFGRVILAGSILRPDFEWEQVKKAELVGEVLNHYATKDPIVPLAHWTIWDSGPSGRRGFDSSVVTNIRAEGLGHSDLFAVDKCVKDDAYLQPCPNKEARGQRHLDHTYERYWRPFLQLPNDELSALPDISPPRSRWRQGHAALRGTLLPLFALPLVVSLLVMAVAGIGGPLSRTWSPFGWVAAGTGLGIGALLLGVFVTLGWRRTKGQKG